MDLKLDPFCNRPKKRYKMLVISAMDLQMAFSTSFFRLLEFDSFSVVEERVDLSLERR